MSTTKVVLPGVGDSLVYRVEPEIPSHHVCQVCNINYTSFFVSVLSAFGAACV